MTNRILSIGAIVLFVPLISGWAVDFTGNWIVQIPSSQGAIKTVFCFKVDGTELTGKVITPEGDTPISEGKIDGDEISFVVKRNIGEKQIVQRYRGKLAGRVYGDEIKFTLEVQSGTGETEGFTAKREFPLGDYDRWPVIKEPPSPIILPID
jgi:hypothetical protein